MADFAQMSPPQSITNPTVPDGEKPVAEYPAHVHRAVAEPTETSIVVAWVGKKPIHNEYLIVANDDERKTALADGWSDDPVVPDTDKTKAKAKDKAKDK